MSGDDRFDLVDWLTLKRRLDFSKARWLGPLFAVVATLLVVLAIGAAFTLLVRALFGGLLDIPGSSLGVGGVTVALIGAPFVIWRSIVAQKQADISEQGLITDRINKAVEGLGAEKAVSRIGRSMQVVHLSPRGDPVGENTFIEWSGQPFAPPEGGAVEKIGDWTAFEVTEPNLEVRIGAIYALERISQDSARDHIQIMEILCAYVRENAGLSDPFDIERNGAPQVTKPRSDVAAAIKVIGRRPKQMRDEAHQFLSASRYSRRFDMRNIDLTGADLRDLTFSDIDFSGSSFRSANMMNAKFENVLFNGSNLSDAKTRTAEAFGKTVFNFCLFSGLESLEVLKPLSRDKVLWCALKSTQFKRQSELDSLKENKRTMLSVWFGDGSVEWLYTTPGETPRHWPQSVLDWGTFKKEWDKWRDNDLNYAPPNPPKPAK